MSDIAREFNRKYGAYKALVTRYRNMGYDITDEYIPPKKITEGSLRRLEQARAEIRRQKDVQEARAYIRAREARADIMELIRGYVNNSIIGHTGKNDSVGLIGKGDGYLLKQASQNDLEIVVIDAFEKARQERKYLQFAENVNTNIDYLEDIIERYILAVYRKKTAQWSADAGARWGEYMRMLSGFKNTLFRGL